MSPILQLEVEGKPSDPYRTGKEAFGTYCGSVLTNLGLAPSYSYANGSNRLFFHMKKENSGMVAVLARVIVVAAAIGSLGQIFLPEALRTILLTNIVVPVYNTFFNVLSCIAGPMIIEQVNYIVQFFMEFISKLVPYVIFLVIINLIWSGALGVLSNIKYLLLIFIGVLILSGTVFLLSVSICHKVSPRILLKKSMDTFFYCADHGLLRGGIFK